VRALFRKYFLALFLAAVLPLTASGLSNAWFGYQAQRDRLDQLLGAEARAAASRIEGFLHGINDQLGWLVQLPWTDEADERRRIDALRLLRQVPAVMSLTLVDASGRERLHVSRIGLNRTEAGIDLSSEPPVVGARKSRLWYGEVGYVRGSEPYLTVAMAGNRPSVGIVVAEVNLKLIWDVISAIQVGETGHAFVLDKPGRLIAHRDISLVLRGAHDTTLEPLRAIRAAVMAANGRLATGEDAQKRAVAAAATTIPDVDWTVLVEQPLSEAFEPIYTALWRTGALLLGGVALAGILAYWLARRMTGPIRLLQQGTEQVGAGRFDHRIHIRSGDELERLAESFNSMAEGLAVSQERQERIGKLKRFLAPQVAELVDRTGEDSMLEGRRADVVAVFGDLRGFTAFSVRTPPDEVMQLLSEYHEALGIIISQHQATLTHFNGDGLMILVNAPVPVAEPVLTAIDMAVAMQCALQRLIGQWRGLGYRIGFGVGLAYGTATVGRIGYEGRYDYTAIGSVVNLASRLCASAEDGEILVDSAAAAEARDGRPLLPLGQRPIRGFDEEIQVFSVDIAELTQVA
jgi:adenylate cyclase